MLTRAKKGLIIVGNKTTLETSDPWLSWLQQAPDLSLEDLKVKQPNLKESDKKRKGKSAKEPMKLKR